MKFFGTSVCLALISSALIEAAGQQSQQNALSKTAFDFSFDSIPNIIPEEIKASRQRFTAKMINDPKSRPVFKKIAQVVLAAPVNAINAFISQSKAYDLSTFVAMVSPYIKILPLELAKIDLKLRPWNTNMNEIYEAFALFHGDLLRIIRDLPEDVLFSQDLEPYSRVIPDLLVQNHIIGTADLKTVEELRAEILEATQNLAANLGNSKLLNLEGLMTDPKLVAGLKAAVDQLLEALKVIIDEIAKAFKIADYSGFAKLLDNISPAIIPLFNQSFAPLGLSLETLVNSVLNVDTGRIDENIDIETTFTAVNGKEKNSTAANGNKKGSTATKGKGESKSGTWSRNTIVIIASVSVSIAMIIACVVVYLKF